ncbi:MAG TPA: hypothetical protein VL442_09240 [Mucilaginibacter sp.]|nr:hypothetical protein [Mucilaginibacter sp.]
MQTKVIGTKTKHSSHDAVKSALSIKTFVDYLKSKIDNETTIKSEFCRFVLKKIDRYEGLADGMIKITDIQKLRDVFELIYATLTSAAESNNKFCWAIATPVLTKIIYGTDDFFSFLKEHQKGKNLAAQGTDALFAHENIDFIYRLILQKLYHFPAEIHNDTIYSYQQPKSDIVKYNRLRIDTTFIEVTTAVDLPEINPEHIEACLYEGRGMQTLSNIIPLSMFTLEGFAVVTVDDFSAEHSLQTIRDLLVSYSSSPELLYVQVLKALQIMAGIPTVEFGLLPFIKLNGQLMLKGSECRNSFLIKSGRKFGSGDVDSEAFLNEYIKKPTALFFSTISEKKIEQYRFLEAIKKAGIASYAILPIFYNRQPAGIMEIYSAKKTVFYEKLLSHLQPAVPLLSQLLQDSILQFEARLDRVIKNKFTTIQPSVEWKFNQAAGGYLLKKPSKNETAIESVSFGEVFPLFGSVDIRDSTIQHNQALKNDIKILNKILAGFFKSYKKTAGKDPNIQSTFKSWKKQLKKQLKSNDENQIKDYIKRVITPGVEELSSLLPALEKPLDKYRNAVNEKEGLAYSNRLALESSLKSINNALTKYYENAQVKLQKIYPCYFEKFRTDGVEYDIYTGHSISPEHRFTATHLKKFRIWQLKSMIDVCHLTKAMLPKLLRPLRTAPLIFVHSGKINLCFRNDERRFDVEGYYNIRYEVIKKRIDKVRIRKTEERLTQPDKIALVYFNDSDVKDFLDYVSVLQKDGALKNDLEHLELEELQGVSGLKAFRVSVNYKD